MKPLRRIIINNKPLVSELTKEQHEARKKYHNERRRYRYRFESGYKEKEQQNARNYYSKYSTYRDKVLKLNNIKNKISRAKLQKFKSEKGCGVCGEKDSRCLDFHHIDPKTKKFRLAVCGNRSWESLETEIKKCRILCANCHRKLHFNEQQIKNKDKL